jgi:Ca2+-binding EF-hand superfamily protein
VQDLKVGLHALGFESEKNEIERLVKNLNRPIVAKDNQDKEKQGTISLEFKDFSEIMAMKMSEPAAENELRNAFILFRRKKKPRLSQ